MRELFPGYYRPLNEQIEKMWQEGVFAFDTNILLNIYRYTSETRERLFEILHRLQDQIWIPYQVAYEYQHRRLEVINEELLAYQTIKQSLDDCFKKLQKDLDKYKRHASIDVAALKQEIKEAFDKTQGSLNRAKKSHPKLHTADKLRDKLDEIFEGRVGNPYTQEQLFDIYEQARKRFQWQIPPGFSDDTRKPEPDKFGDVVIWFQMIDHAKAQQKPLLFVTGDVKQDWWLYQGDNRIGPRPELLQEMFTKAETPFYMYDADEFLIQAEKHLNLHPQPAAIEEVREIRKEDELSAKAKYYVDMGNYSTHQFTPPNFPATIGYIKAFDQTNLPSSILAALPEGLAQASEMQQTSDVIFCAQQAAMRDGYDPISITKIEPIVKMDGYTMISPSFNFASSWRVFMTARHRRTGEQVDILVPIEKSVFGVLQAGITFKPPS